MPVAPVEAVEYRLEVVSMWDTAFNAFVKPGELDDRASGPGLEELVASLDRGSVPRGPLLTDRTAGPSRRLPAPMAPCACWPRSSPAEGKARWGVVKWDGRAGE